MSAGGTPTLTNLTLTLANTEYSVVLTGAKQVAFRCRTAVEVRYAFATGKVATPTAPYSTLPAGATYSNDLIGHFIGSVYFASGTAAVVMEVESWA